ncbi:MAG: DUF2357 domain-containing protein [Salinibacter sp.]
MDEDSVSSVSRKEAVVETEIGPIALGLRRYVYDTRRGQYFDTGEREWFAFDDKDPERTRPILEDTRQLAFEAWTQEASRDPLLVYLGTPSDPWDEELSIELQNRALQGEWVRWATGSEETNEDVKRIRTNYWCAAQAQITLYQRQFDEDTEEWIPTPVRRPDGSILSTRIALGYGDEDYRELYEGVLSDLSRRTVRGNLASPMERFVDYQEMKQRQEETPGLELFKRLEGILPRYRDTLCQIIRDPDTALSIDTEHVALNLRQAEEYFQHHSPHPPLQQVHEVVDTAAGRVPTEFTTSKATSTVETSANRFVAESVRRVRNCVERVRDHLVKEKKQLRLDKHEAALGKLNEYEEALRRYAGALPYSPEEATHRFEDRSAVTYYDGRYSRLRRLTDLLDALMDFVDASEDSIPFEVQAFNKAYEHWCFIHTIRALREVGFEFVDEKGRHVTPFYQNPVPDKVNARMTHPSRPGRLLEVWYERQYQPLRSENGYFDTDRPYGLERRGLDYTDYTGNKRCPDIALEWHKVSSEGKVASGTTPRIITLDPTLRSPRPAMTDGDRPVEDKYDYKRALRSFVEEGADGKSKEIVDAAWGMSPDLHAGPRTHVHRPSSGYAVGFVLLRPRENSLEAFPETLGTILDEAGWINFS